MPISELAAELHVHVQDFGREALLVKARGLDRPQVRMAAQDHDGVGLGRGSSTTHALASPVSNGARKSQATPSRAARTTTDQASRRNQRRREAERGGAEPIEQKQKVES